MIVQGRRGRVARRRGFLRDARSGRARIRGAYAFRDANDAPNR